MPSSCSASCCSRRAGSRACGRASRWRSCTTRGGSSTRASSWARAHSCASRSPTASGCPSRGWRCRSASRRRWRFRTPPCTPPVSRGQSFSTATHPSHRASSSRGLSPCARSSAATTGSAPPGCVPAICSASSRASARSAGGARSWSTRRRFRCRNSTSSMPARSGINEGATRSSRTPSGSSACVTTSPVIR